MRGSEALRHSFYSSGPLQQRGGAHGCDHVLNKGTDTVGQWPAADIDGLHQLQVSGVLLFQQRDKPARRDLFRQMSDCNTAADGWFATSGIRSTRRRGWLVVCRAELGLGGLRARSN